MAPQQQQQPLQWKGTAMVELPKANPDKAWAPLSDFFGIHRWLPSVQICHRVDGDDSVGGDLVRYCASGEAESFWAKERLLFIDQVGRSYSYDIIDNNIGFRRYVATLKVVSGESSGDGGGSRVMWSFESDPVEGWTEKSLTAYLQNGLEELAKKIDELMGME